MNGQKLIFSKRDVTFIIDFTDKGNTFTVRIFEFKESVGYTDIQKFLYTDIQKFLNNWIFTVLTIDGMFEKMIELNLFTTEDLLRWGGIKSSNGGEKQ